MTILVFKVTITNILILHMSNTTPDMSCKKTWGVKYKVLIVVILIYIFMKFFQEWLWDASQNC